MKKFVVLLLVLLAFASFVVAKSLEIGAKNYTEQYILGSLVSQLLEANGFDVDENFGMSTFAVRSGLETGQIDMYPDYTGTAWTTYLGHEEVISDPNELYELVKAEDYERNNVVWLDRINFNNTYAIAVRDEFAAEHGLKTLSDLADYLNNTDERHLMGIDFEFYERPDGFFAMADTYGMEVSKNDVKTMEVGMTYEAIDRGSIDVAMVFSTDGKLSRFNLVVLEDNLNFFPIYNPCVLVREEVLEEYPEIVDILAPLGKYFNADIMIRLNYLVDAAGYEPDEVAEAYLNGLGLLGE